MSEYQGFDEEQGGPVIVPGEATESQWTIEEVAPIIGEDVRITIENGGVFDPGDPETYKRDIERLIEKGEEYDRAHGAGTED
jgi:hypothetical protein